jgi:hypothetical protein
MFLVPLLLNAVPLSYHNMCLEMSRLRIALRKWSNPSSVVGRTFAAGVWAASSVGIFGLAIQVEPYAHRRHEELGH